MVSCIQKSRWVAWVTLFFPRIESPGEPDTLSWDSCRACLPGYMWCSRGVVRESIPQACARPVAQPNCDTTMNQGYRISTNLMRQGNLSRTHTPERPQVNRSIFFLFQIMSSFRFFSLVHALIHPRSTRTPIWLRCPGLPPKPPCQCGLKFLSSRKEPGPSSLRGEKKGWLRKDNFDECLLLNNAWALFVKLINWIHLMGKRC